MARSRENMKMSKDDIELAMKVFDKFSRANGESVSEQYSRFLGVVYALDNSGCKLDHSKCIDKFLQSQPPE